jgi:hypothetical protein
VTDFCTTGNGVYSFGFWSASKSTTPKYWSIMSDAFLRHEVAVLHHLPSHGFSVRCSLHQAPKKIYKAFEVHSTAIITGMLLKT